MNQWVGQWMNQWNESMGGSLGFILTIVYPSNTSKESEILHKPNRFFHASPILLFWIQTTNNIRVLLWRSSSPRSTTLLHIHRRDRLLLQQSLRHSLHIRSVRLQHLQRLLHRLRQNPLRREVNLPSCRLTTLKFPRFPYLNGFWKLSPIC